MKYRSNESKLRQLIRESVTSMINEVGDTPKGQYKLGQLAKRKENRHNPDDGLPEWDGYSYKMKYPYPTRDDIESYARKQSGVDNVVEELWDLYSSVAQKLADIQTEYKIPKQYADKALGHLCDYIHNVDKYITMDFQDGYSSDEP